MTIVSPSSGGAVAPQWSQREGLPLPLGVTWMPEEHAYNVALYSKHAERVTFLAYREGDLAHAVFALDLDYAHHKSGRVWHCRIPEDQLNGARYYAYSVDGPAPAGRFEFHAFDAAKVLLDPYAQAVHFPDGFSREAASRPGSNAGRAPLGVLPEPSSTPIADPVRGPSPNRGPLHESDAVIYELHVRNFTRHPSSGVSEDKRGTFAGIVEKIPYLLDLGVTIVELMPVFQCDPSAPGRWGYMPLSFFALHRAYTSAPDPGGEHREFRDMVDALHAAGIEIILDVVYNHTCERGSTGPVYSYKGIDNSTYYIMTDDPREPYADFAGTGNTMNCANYAVRKMILDSMRHWVELGIDGFRFDLASIYARDADGAMRYHDPPIISEISSDPEFARLRLIAEPWDVGAYQLGRGFPGLTWHQWNGMFRDDLRRFVRGDPAMVPALMRRLYGSDDLFPDTRLHAYRPPQSVNYVTCHDGQTLYDLVSYNHKHNWANGEGNLDGPPQNFSWNCGWEGDDRVPDDVAALRVRQTKNFFMLLLLANGTPMLRAGDEFLQTQRGNDNPYNQDNETTWLDWSRSDRFADVARFVKLGIAFRKAHPSLGRSRFWREDVRWHGTGPNVDTSPDSQTLAYCLRGGSQGDRDIYVMVNASQESVMFDIQAAAVGGWRQVVDTYLSAPDDFRAPGDEAVLTSCQYTLGPRSVVVLVAA